MTAESTKGALRIMPSIASRRGGSAFVPASLLLSVLLATLSLFLAGAAFAQTGSISGTVKDQGGVPIQGANVAIVGASTGGFTNAQGVFTVPKIPVGVYTIRIRIAGFANQDKTGVQVNANRATDVGDITMAEQVYKVKVVDVQGDQKIAIRKKDSSTKQLVTSEDLHSLPVDSYKDAIGLKAGVISQGGELHFRGGRADEVLTVVNGIASRNPLQSEGVDLGLLAVSSSEQVLGGMDAQYGNALSGVINLTTREGGDHFAGEGRYFTDRYGEHDKEFNNFERLSVGAGGPFLFSKTNYYLSYEGT
ncbi:MAG: carboxypeptidase regulatory-like domain-containing protein, partial [Candidatus Eiseniibacteriota bacterium]